MNRTFHARIAVYQYLLLLIFAANAFVFLWFKYTIAALFIILLLIFIIERIIHTTYTITKENHLMISQGRFSKKIDIPIREVTAMRRCNSMKFGHFSVTNYILIEYGKNRFASVMPVKEEEFLDVMFKRMNQLTEEEQNEEKKSS